MPALLTDDRRGPVRALAAAGAALLALGQALTLVHVRPFSDYWYGIVWTGFILLADAIVAKRTGASLLLDRRRDFWAMVLASAGLWWLFELANVVLLDSWGYSPSPDVPRWVQRLRSTYFFATLLPATWEASLLAMLVRRPLPCPAPAPPGRWFEAALAAGVATGALIAVRRDLSLPLGLIALGLITDAINLRRGRPSLLAHLRAGRPGVPLAIGAGNIAAGFVGEMWNYPADPRWTYHVPYADVLRVFAMPLPGYLGYAALALDLFALYHLLRPSAAGDARLAGDHPLSLTGLG